MTDHIIEPIYTIEGIIEETIECEFDDDSDGSNDSKDQYENKEFDAQWLNRKLQDVTTVLNHKAKDPVFYQATKQFIHTFEQISHSAMISALHCFGKNLCSWKIFEMDECFVTV